MLTLAACAPRTQDSGMAGGVRTESAQEDAAEGEMTGGSDGLSVEMEDMTGGDVMGGEMMDSDMAGDMTGGDNTGGDMTGGEMMDGDMMGDMTGGDMTSGDMTGGSEMDMSTDAQAGMESDTEPPGGTLEAAASPAGPFYNDRPGGIADISDERVVRVSPGSSFFLRLSYSDPSGISDLDISLRNSEFQGDLPSGPFTIDEAASTSTCDDQLALNPTDLECIIKVDVAPDATNIAQSSEFAYVFRARVSDAAGNSEVDNDRGYVALQ